MHSDQTRKDGSSESMIQALYYDFVANYVKTRMYSTRYVQCNSGGQSSADRGATDRYQYKQCIMMETETNVTLGIDEVGLDRVYVSVLGVL